MNEDKEKEISSKRDIKNDLSNSLLSSKSEREIYIHQKQVI